MRRLGLVGKVGAVVCSGLGMMVPSAQAQYGGGYAAYAGPEYGAVGYPGVSRGVSVQIGVGGGYAGAYQNYQGYPAAGPGVYQAAPAYSPPVQGYGGYPSPAARQGYREGRLYYETGIAPNRPLSPAESRGFLAGERRAAATPWQLDPARQQGYREGQRYWETGIAPNRPLSPAEAQGFQAGEARASAGAYSPYR